MDNATKLVLGLFYLNGLFMLLLWCCIVVFSKTWGDRIAFILTTVAVVLLAGVFFYGSPEKVFDEPPQDTYHKSTTQGVRKWT